MKNKEKREVEKKVIIDSLHIDEEGLKDVKVINIESAQKELGIIDIPAFVNGILDGENDEEFNESSVDYIKGYKYGKTGQI